MSSFILPVLKALDHLGIDRAVIVYADHPTLGDGLMTDRGVMPDAWTRKVRLFSINYGRAIFSDKLQVDQRASSFEGGR